MRPIFVFWLKGPSAWRLAAARHLSVAPAARATLLPLRGLAGRAPPLAAEARLQTRRHLQLWPSSAFVAEKRSIQHCIHISSTWCCYAWHSCHKS